MAELDPLAFQKSFAATQGIFDNANQNRLAEMALQRKLREDEKQNALAAVISDAANYDEGGNLKREVLPRIAQADPASYGMYRKAIADQDKAQVEQQKAKREELLSWIQYAEPRMANVNSPETWAAFKTSAAQLFPDFASRLPDQYDPATIQQARANAVPIVEQLKMAQRDQEFKYRQENDRANRDLTMRGQDITMRGQDLTDTRAREANALKTAEGKAPTEFQSKAAIYSARAEEADRILQSLQGKYSPAALSAKSAVSNVPVIGGVLGVAANAVTSPENQKAEQAQRDFINAVLRQESGAVISDQEFDNARKQYFPQPGDSAEVVAQKAANRRTAIEGIRRGAGKAAYSASTSKPSLSDIFGD